MLDFNRVADLLSGLTLLKYFPSDDGARLELAKLIARMASNEDQVEWLVQRTLALCTEWPGPVVLRQIHCSKFKPADGVEAGSTLQFPDGPPNELGGNACLAERALEAAPRLALPPGHVATADPEIDAEIKRLAEVLDMNRPRPRPKIISVHAQEVPTNPNFTPITQADIDRAVQQYRDKKARQELGW